MADHHHDPRVPGVEDMQQRWHGWGSPVGLGIWALCAGGFVVLLAAAWALVT